MRSTTPLRGALLACTLLVLACSDAPDSGQPFPASVVARLDQRIGGMVADGLGAGAMVTVGTPQGTLTRTYGLADRESGVPMRDDLLFRIGSITKTMTVTVLLQLVDEGRLGLDDAISRYLDGVPRGDEITLRMMAEMTSGLPNYTENPTFAAAVTADWSYQWRPEELLGFAYDQSFLFTPGTSLHYSNTNTVLLGILTEKIEGKPIGTVLRERIFDRLGLTQTSWPEGRSFPGPHVHGYSTFNREDTLQDASSWSPSEAFTAGEVISSLPDVRAWIGALARGDVLSPEMQRERLDWSPVGGNSAARFYALGIFGINGWLGHDGDIPGYSSFAMHHPELDASVVVMVNADSDFHGYNPASALILATTEILFPGHVIDNGH